MDREEKEGQKKTIDNETQNRVDSWESNSATVYPNETFYF